MRKVYLFLVAIAVAGIAAAQQQSRGPEEAMDIKLVKVSPKLTELKAAVISTANEKGPENESIRKQRINWYEDNALPKGADPVLQQDLFGPAGTAAASVQVLSNWEGLVANVEPSDNTIAVGPNHVVQMINGSGTLIRIWDKQGNVLVNQRSVADITGSANVGDPNIVYDAQANRYVFLVIGGNILTTANITICISVTNDPTGSYYVYRVAKTSGLFSPSFPDYPKLSVWGNAYYVTTNSSGPIIWALNRSQMLAGAASVSTQRFKLKDFPGGGVQSTSPVTITGNAAPPANSRAVVMRVFDDAWSSAADVDVLELYGLSIDWSNSLNSTILGPLRLNIAAYDSRLCSNDLNASSCVPQPGVTRKLDAMGGLILDKAQYYNFGTYESIVCTHMSDARGDGVAGMRWYELRRTGNSNWSIFQQGTYSPNDGSHRFLSSVSINGQGTIAMGYNISGTTLFPGIRITGRNSGDAAGAMTAPETIAQAGSAAQTSSNRYGDYNGLVADADGSFWLTANYNPTAVWSTRVIHFRINNTGAAPVVTEKQAVPIIAAIPNPARNMVTVSFESKVAGRVPLEIVNWQGTVFVQKYVQVNKGSNKLQIDISNVPTGYYMIKCTVDGQLAMQKLAVQK